MTSYSSKLIERKTVGWIYNNGLIELKNKSLEKLSVPFTML